MPYFKIWEYLVSGNMINLHLTQNKREKNLEEIRLPFFKNITNFKIKQKISKKLREKFFHLIQNVVQTFSCYLFSEIGFNDLQQTKRFFLIVVIILS